MSRSQTELERRRRHHRRRSRRAIFFLSALSLASCLMPLTSAPVQALTSTMPISLAPALTPTTEYYVTLPKLGHNLKGLRLAGEPNVLAFLNIPYATPPTRLLRFMPPGAPSANQLNQQQQQCSTSTTTNMISLEKRLLWPSRQRSLVRLHRQFGCECVQLSHWLPDDMKDSSSNNQSVKINSSRIFANAAAAASGRQSEDCLNLNLFLPLASESAPPISSSPEDLFSESKQNNNSTSSMRQQIMMIGSPDQGQYLQDNNRKQEAISMASQSIPTARTGSQPINQEQHGKPLMPVVFSRQHHHHYKNQFNNTNGMNNSTKSAGKQEALRFPVLVIFHAKQYNHHGAKSKFNHKDDQLENKANTFSYMPIARKSNAIVITFNFRVGLLGFLPYVDAGSDMTATRNNHAIWDQIALLDWLRRNVAAFNGDPTNVTLIAADNQASLYIQLLCMTPHAKGLFKRAVFIRDDRMTDVDLLETGSENLAHLVRSALEARDARRNLASALRQIISQILNKTPSDQMSQVNDDNSNNDFLLSANITQLAELNSKIEKFNQVDNQIIKLINGPTLDDKLLFPHLIYLIKSMAQVKSNNINFFERIFPSNNTIRNELNYCLYTKQLYEFNRNENIPFDELDVLPNKPQTNQTILSINKSWHRDNMNSRQKTKSTFRRLMIGSSFNHLRQLRLIINLLYNKSSPSLNQSEELEEDSDDLLSHQQQSRTILLKSIGNLKRRSTDSAIETILGNSLSDMTHETSIHGSKPLTKRSHTREHLEGLFELISSYDMMFGYFQSEKYIPQIGENTQKIDKINLRIQLKQENFFDWLKWLDFAYSAEFLANHTTLTQFCDIFWHQKIRETNHFAFTIDFSAQNEAFSIDTQSDGNWLLESTDESSIMEAIRSFLRFGDPSSGDGGGGNNSLPDSLSNCWPRYDILHRNIKEFVVNPTRGELMNSPKSNIKSTRDEINFHLNIMPYVQNLFTSPQNDNDSQAGHSMKEPIQCLRELNVLNRLTESNRSKESNESDDKLQCIQNLTLYYRSQLRQYAAEDLEPLIKFIDKQQQQLEQQEHQQLSSHHSGSSASITTRNLLANDLLGLNDQQQQQQRDEGLSSSNSTNSTIFVAYVGPPATGKVNNTSLDSHPISMSSGESRFLDFISGTYKKTNNKAWLIIIVTAFSLVILNLFIVCIISFSRRRQSGNQVYENQNALVTQLNANSTPAQLKRSSIKKQIIDQNLANNQMIGQYQPNKKQLKFDLSGTIDRQSITDNNKPEMPFTQLASQSIFLPKALEDKFIVDNQKIPDNYNSGIVLDAVHLPDVSTEPEGTTVYHQNGCQYANHGQAVTKDQSHQRLMQDDHNHVQHQHQYHLAGSLTDNNPSSQTHSITTSDNTTTTCGQALSYDRSSSNDQPSNYNYNSINRISNCPHHGSQSSIIASSSLKRNSTNLMNLLNHHQMATYSAVSPSSSTTISVTPNQFNANNIECSSSPMNDIYQVEPITLFYPTDDNQKNFQILSAYATATQARDLAAYQQEQDRLRQLELHEILPVGNLEELFNYGQNNHSHQGYHNHQHNH